VRRRRSFEEAGGGGFEEVRGVRHDDGRGEERLWLDVASELKILRLHQELAAEQPLEIVSTFLGAHVVPAEFRGKANGTEKYIALLTEN